MEMSLCTIASLLHLAAVSQFLCIAVVLIHARGHDPDTEPEAQDEVFARGYTSFRSAKPYHTSAGIARGFAVNYQFVIIWSSYTLTVGLLQNEKAPFLQLH